MNRYDEDRVIALLHEAVPPVPEAPDRIAAVKIRAGRQRAALWTQTLGAVASVLLVVGVAAAVSGPDGPRRIDPTDDPLKALALALVNETSVRFEARMAPVGDPKPVPGAGLTSEQVREVMTGRVTGAATRDGDFTITGDASFVRSWALGYDPDMDAGQVNADELRYDVDFRFVDGVAYRNAMPDEDVPAGKKWISDTNTEVNDVDDLRRALNLLGTFAEKVRYVREYDIASEPVAEYELTVPAKVTSSVPVKVRFALDAANRLRRVTSQFSFTELTMGGYEEMSAEVQPPVTLGSGAGEGWTEYSEGGDEPDQRPSDLDPMVVKVEVDLFGYGDDIVIKAPPAREVTTEDALYSGTPGFGPDDALTKCLDKVGDDAAKARACFAAAEERRTGARPTSSPGACMQGPDGTFSCTDSTGATYGSGYGDGTASAEPSPARAEPRPTMSPAA